MRYAGAILVVLAMTPRPTLAACNEFVSLDPLQMREDSSALEDADASEIDQIIAFDNLRCSDQPTVRDLALRMGAVSTNASLRAAVLFESIAQRAMLSVDLLEEDNLTKAHYERLASAPTLELGADGVLSGTVTLKSAAGMLTFPARIALY